MAAEPIQDVFQETAMTTIGYVAMFWSRAVAVSESGETKYKMLCVSSSLMLSGLVHLCLFCLSVFILDHG